MRRAKQEINSLIYEVEELSRSDAEPAEFFAALLDKSITALAALGGVVWTLEETGAMKLEYQVGLKQSGLVESQRAQAQHGRLLQQVVEKSEAALVAPHSGFGGGDDSGEDVAANPTDHLLVLAPILTDQGVEGLVEVFQRTGARANTQRGYLKFLDQICRLAGQYLKNRRLQQYVSKQSLWEQLESFTGLVHGSLDSRETAYTIANEGRRLIGCDRVTVAVKRGSKFDVVAISGQDTFDKRSNVVRMLRDLTRTVARTGDDMWFDGDASNLAPQVEKAVNAYVDESQTKQIAVLPLREGADEDLAEQAKLENKQVKRRDVLGAVVIEQLVDGRQPDGLMQRVDVVRRHSATALSNAREIEGLFLLPLWRLLGKTRVLVTARNLPKTVLATAAIAGVIGALCYLPYDFTVVADGKLLPEVRNGVFASQDGKVVEVNVDHGSRVKQGDELVRLESTDLEADVENIEGQIATTNQQLASAVRQKQQDNGRMTDGEGVELSGRINELNASLKSLTLQRALLAKKEQELSLKSPIDGLVVTWKVRETIRSRPVRQGLRLMEIADPSSPWELEVFVPESKMGYVAQQLKEQRSADADSRLKVTFILATHPSIYLEGEVVSMDTNAEVKGEEGNTVKMTITFDQSELLKVTDDPSTQLKVGADVKAKIACGERPIGFVWFHDLFEFVQSKILFRL
ncbi:MAG: HlyD family efflux transporter periplasmic adaptor subunit [Planctomycetota bacterium]